MDADRIENGANWVLKAFALVPKLTADLRAYMVYALALAGQAAARRACKDVYDKRSRLSPYGLALLGLTFEQVKDEAARDDAAARARTIRQSR